MTYPSTYDAGLRPAGRGALSATMRYLLSLAGPAPTGTKPLTPAQMRGEATKFVEAQTLPLIDSVKKSIEARAKGGAQGITGYTQTMMGKLAGMAPRVKAGYDTAIADAQGSDRSLMDWMVKQGVMSQEELAAKTAAAGVSNPDTSAAQAAATTGLATGAAAATGALGNANAQRLIAQRAGDVAAVEKMPAVFAQGGMHTLRNLNLQLNREQSERIAEISARAPGLAAEILNQLQERELRKSDLLSRWRETRAGIGAQALDRFYDRELQKSIYRQGFGTDAAQFELDQRELDEIIRHNQATEFLQGQGGGVSPENRGVALANAGSDLASLYESMATETFRKRYWFDPDKGGPKPGKWIDKYRKGAVTRLYPSQLNPEKVTKPAEYQAALKRGVAQVGPILRQYGFTEQEIRSFVLEQMAAAGIVKPQTTNRRGGP